MAKFDFEKELAKVMANPPNKEGEDEMTTNMHETFSLSEEDEKKHAVFAFLTMLTNDPNMNTEEEMAEYSITKEDLSKYRGEWLQS
jgi:hypothetical protein